jgi:isoleucyl-tRNA synthetase
MWTKELGSKKKEMTQAQVRENAGLYAEKFIDIQRDEFKRLGVMGEWDDPYLTMSFRYEATIARELCKFALDGSLFRSKKPITGAAAVKPPWPKPRSNTTMKPRPPCMSSFPEGRSWDIDARSWPDGRYPW